MQHRQSQAATSTPRSWLSKFPSSISHFSFIEFVLLGQCLHKFASHIGAALGFQWLKSIRERWSAKFCYIVHRVLNDWAGFHRHSSPHGAHSHARVCLRGGGGTVPCQCCDLSFPGFALLTDEDF